MHSVQVITLGCSKNRVDSEHLLAQLPADEFVILPESNEGKVDYLLLNTCGFIGDAKEESINAIFEAVQRKKDGIAGKVMVFGCLSQRYADEMPALIPEVDAWFGARDIDPVVKALGAKPDHRKFVDRIPTEGAPGYAYLKISEGCDRRCSYCAIPHIRGAHKSVPMDELVLEARNLASRGVKELVLIAQDTTFYGLDLYHRRALAELIRRISTIDGIEWIRIHYSYPADFPDDVLYEMANNPKVCKYLDIPLQHISDKVLDMMHRHVDGTWTRNLISRLRNVVPGVVLRTTMITGHPGEGTKEFKELLQFVKDARFERLGAFTYSEEEGTFGALNFKDTVRQSTKQRRLDELMSLQSAISLDFNESRVGSTVKVMVDDYVGGNLICRSQYESPEVDGEIIVPCEDESRVQDLIGNFTDVRIKSADLYDLTGELL